MEAHAFTQGDPSEEIRVGISACLLGDPVRFDGGHKRDRFLEGTLSEFFRFIRVCPEVDIGLGVPRESLRLVRMKGDHPRLLATKSGTDHTTTMEEYARAKVDELRKLDLSGYLLKRSSPSCGMERVKVYDDHGAPARDGVGVFARVLKERWPELPVEEEGRLHDPRLRENFIERVFGFHRVTTFFAGDWNLGGLVRFHTAEKYLLLSHEPEGYSELGRLVANAKGRDPEEIAAEYRARYLAALAVPATPNKHINVLQHMLGYLRDVATPEARAELHGAVEDYRQGYVPLVVPVTLLQHYVRIHGIEYLRGQRYLEPHPKELMIRNHV
ncbi:MAG: DUF523 and DUF1722 domain-containing protein [bacterium]